MSKPRPSRTGQALRLLAGAALLAALIWYLVPSWSELTTNVDVSIPQLGLGLLAAAIVHVVVAARWQLLAESTGGTRLSLWAYLHSLLVTRFLGQFVSSLAMDLVGRGVALRAVGSERGVGHTTTLVVLERIFDLVIPAALLGWVIAVRQLDATEYAGLMIAGGSVLFLALATPGLRPLARLALSVYGRLKRGQGGDIPLEITTGVSFKVALLSLVRFAAVIVQFRGIGAGIGLVLGWFDWTAATPVAQLTALVGVTPGGLGVVEVGWWAGLAWVGVERTVIGAFLLAQRTALIGFLGILALASWPLARGATRRLSVRT